LSGDALRARQHRKRPLLAAKLLTDDAVGFLEFLSDEACRNYCVALFGYEETSAGTMLKDFATAKDFRLTFMVGRQIEQQRADQEALKEIRPACLPR